ncbi:MAG: Ig-like domain-containing protein [Dehalococcoidia bacterium]
MVRRFFSVGLLAAALSVGFLLLALNVATTPEAHSSHEQLTTLIGTCTAPPNVGGGYAEGGGPGSGTPALLNNPWDVVYHAGGNDLYFNDSANSVIRRIELDADGGSPETSLVAGSPGQAGLVDAVGTDARIGGQGATLTLVGDVIYFADLSNRRIRKLDLITGTVSTIAGNGANAVTDNANGANASFSGLGEITSDGSELYVTDLTFLRTINLTAPFEVDTIAGVASPAGYSDNSDPLAAELPNPRGLAFNSLDGNLYFGDTEAATIRRMNLATGAISTIAGTPNQPGSVDGVGAAARFVSPRGIEPDASGGFLYISDTNGASVRRLNLFTTAVATFAGTFQDGCTNAGGPALTTPMRRPRGLALDSLGNVFVADFNGDAIIRVDGSAAPEAVDDVVVTPINDDVVFDPRENDTDPGNHQLHIISFSTPAHGDVECTVESCTYTPDTGYTGPDSFTYVVGNGSTSDSATVSIGVNAFCDGQPATRLGTAGNEGNLQGTAGADVIVAFGGNDVINGGGGADRICGEAGTDVLIGGAGADVLIGGPGADLASYQERGGGLTINLAGAAKPDGDTYSSIEGLRGTTGNDALKGNNAANRLEGLAGADTLTGLGGADILVGGSGVDTVTYTGAAGVTVTLGNPGSASGGDVLTTVENVKGTSGEDTITGSNSANRLEGLDGDDVLLGSGGADQLLGGDGSDFMNGGAGNDVCNGNSNPPASPDSAHSSCEQTPNVP